MCGRKPRDILSLYSYLILSSKTKLKCLLDSSGCRSPPKETPGQGYIRGLLTFVLERLCTRTQPLISGGCSVHYWVLCTINKRSFLRLHLCWHTFASLWGACLRFASLWRTNSLGDSCALGAHLSNVCRGLLFCLRKAFIF